MANSTPIYDQFARNRTSLRPVEPIQQSTPPSPPKHSISFVTSAPLNASIADSEVATHSSRPRSQHFGKDRPLSYQMLATQTNDSSSTRHSDLKHTRSQSHALFPVKRKEVRRDADETLKRAQSVLDSRGHEATKDISNESYSDVPLRPRPMSSASTENPLGHRAAVQGALGYAPIPESQVADTAAFSKKFVVVGDGGSGKTCLLMRYKERTFPDAYVPTVFENYITHKYHRGTGKTCEVALWDTAGQEEYDRLRPLSYPETDVLLVCFAIDCPQSLDSVKEKWYPEVLHFCPTTPLILVGCKSDLRNSDRAHDQLEGQGLHMLTVQQGLNIANYIGAEAYMECSSKEMINVDEVFELAMDIAVGTETGVDWQSNSAVGRMLSRGELGASQLGRKAEQLFKGSSPNKQTTDSIDGIRGVGFVGAGVKEKKKRRRRGGCKVL